MKFLNKNKVVCVGAHPDDGEAITADYGRYGPYIKCGKKNAPL